MTAQLIRPLIEGARYVMLEEDTTPSGSSYASRESSFYLRQHHRRYRVCRSRLATSMDAQGLRGTSDASNIKARIRDLKL